MAEIGSYRNVFDDPNEFSKLQDLVLGAIQEFSDYRKGNLTYGEIMFVMECILDNMRSGSEKDAQANIQLKGLQEAPTFSTLPSGFSSSAGFSDPRVASHPQAFPIPLP